LQPPGDDAPQQVSRLCGRRLAPSLWPRSSQLRQAACSQVS
jgi:hypothetical protein